MKRLLFLVILLLMVSSVSAGLEVLSSSQIQFYSQDSDLGKEVFLLQVIENGGSQKIYFNEFEPGDGYKIKSSSGYITGEPGEYQAVYPYSTRSYNGELWNIIKLNAGNTKWFTGIGSATDWCYGLGGDIAGKSGGFGWGDYYCYKINQVGYIADVSGYQYKWSEDIRVWNPLASDYETISLSSSDREGYYEYSEGRKVIAKYSFSGLSLNSYIPDLSSKYSVVQYDSTNTVTERIDTTEVNNYQRFTILDYFLKEWMGPTTYQKVVVNGETCLTCTSQNNPEFIREQIAGDIQNLVRQKTIYESGWTPEVERDFTGDGQIVLTAPANDPPISPVFTIKLDAKWVGVYEPKGQPVIESFEVEKSEYVEGDLNARFVSVVKNIGEDSSFSYSLSCGSGVSIDQVGSQYFPSGDSRTLYHTVRGSTTGGTIIAECCLTVKDRNFPEIVSNKECDIIRFVERNQCPDGMDKGDQTCSITGAIMNCVEVDGILVLQKSAITCEYGCSLSVDGRTATCDSAPGCQDEYEGDANANDGICEAFEKPGEKCVSWEDCTTIGDGYCSVREREGGYAPQDCEPIPPPVDYALMIFIGAMVVVLVVAVFIRLRSEGLIGKK